MAMEILTFDKSLQERLVDFSEILGNRDGVPASQIRSEWSCHVELVIEPVGWRALWKIPRMTCQEFGIHYPTIVVVEVENVDFDELTALVKIVAVQDEIHLPEKYDVPLMELYPTVYQENTALDMIGTANCIDQLRFFFNYLWMPWDFDDDENTDWVTLHLEPRVRLFFDMKRGIVSKETCDVIRSLTREGREIQSKITRLEEDISDEEDDDKLQIGVLDEGRACQLMKLHFRLQQIKTEMEVLENPVMRDVLTRNKSALVNERQTKQRAAREKKSEGYFVWLGGSVLEMQSALNKIETAIGTDIFLNFLESAHLQVAIRISVYFEILKVLDIVAVETFDQTSNCLQEALDCSETGDVIVLGEGQHPIRSEGGLEEGGAIRGLGSLESTVICAGEMDSGPSLMDFSGGEVSMEGVSLHLGELQMGILVRKGLVSLIGCKIVVANKSVVKLGVVVLSGAKLIARNTVFHGLGSALVVHSGGEAILNECRFDECVEGIQLHDDAKLTMSSCELSNFDEHAVRLETQKYAQDSECKSGSFQLLEDISEISVENCVFKNNTKGDVMLQAQIFSHVLTKRDEVTNMVS